MSDGKRYAFVSISGDERIMARNLKEGERHKFSAFRKSPETWYVDGFPGLDQWKAILNLAQLLGPTGNSGLMLKVGHVRLSHRDTYNRKEGVALAKEKAETNPENFMVKQFTYYHQDTMSRQRFSVQLESSETRMFVDIYDNGRPSINTIYKMKNEIEYY